MIEKMFLEFIGLAILNDSNQDKLTDSNNNLKKLCIDQKACYDSRMYRDLISSDWKRT